MADTPVPGDTKPATTPGSPATAPIGEFAGVDRNPYVYDTMGILYPRDPTLAARGGGRSYLIYDEAELDPRVFSVMQKRKRALAAFPWMVTEASSAPADKAAAELVERALHAMNFSALCEYLNDAILKGFSVVELIWELVDDRWWFPVEARIRDQRRFRFDKTYVLRMIDRTNLVNGFELPARKFIVHTFNPKDGDPYGRGLGAILWWRAFFKRQNEAAWLIHNEKYGSPTAVGTYPVGAGPDTQQALLDACRAFSTDSAIIKPDGSTIELLEASGSAGADTFSLFKESQNDDISETVLGATFAANAGPLDGGAGADADTEDRLELARSDADNLAQVLNKTIVAWIVWINMPAARPPALAWEIDAEEDLTARADRDGKVNAMGFDPSEKYINETYGGEWTKKATPEPAQLGADGLPVPAQDAESNPENPSFAEQHEHAPPAGLTETLAFAGQAADQADKVIAGWVDQARKMFADAGSLEEARDRLLDLYPGMSGGMFAEVMTQAIAVSNLAGREGVGRGK